MSIEQVPIAQSDIPPITTTHVDLVKEHKTFEVHHLTDSSELEAARQLRAQVYIDEMEFLGADARDTDGGEHDMDDTRSIHFGVYANNTEERHLAGTARLIVKSGEEDLLPVENYFGIKAPQGSVEASRLVVESNKRAKERELLVSLSLMRMMIQTAADMEAPYVYAVVEEGLYKHFRKIGLPAEQLSDLVQLDSYNSLNMAIRFKTDEVLGAVWDKDTTFKDVDGSGVKTTRPIRMGHFLSAEHEALGAGAFDFDDLLQPNPRMFNRNLGFITSEEQQKLINSTVAIAGAGGDGGLLAEQMVRAGVGTIRLADPESFEPENTNRQAHSNFEQMGRNKAEVVAEALIRINPWLNVELYDEGVTPENVERFVEGSDLVIDETEFTMPELGTMLNREARKYGIGVLMAMNIGWGAQVTSFVPGKGKTFEEWLGIPEGMPIDEVADQEVSMSKWLGHLPSYVDLAVFERVAKGEISAPSLAGGVALAAGVANEQAMAHLIGGKGTKRRGPVIAPGAIVIDPIDGMNTLRNTQFGFYRSMAKLVLRNKLGLVPKM